MPNKVWLKLFIHSQTPTVVQFKFLNGYVHSMLTHFLWVCWEQKMVKYWLACDNLLATKFTWKYHLQNDCYIVSTWMLLQVSGSAFIPLAQLGFRWHHYNAVIMGVIAYQVTSLTIVYSTVYSDADQRKHQSSALLAFVRGIHRGPVNSRTNGK